MDELKRVYQVGEDDLLLLPVKLLQQAKQVKEN